MKILKGIGALLVLIAIPTSIFFSIVFLCSALSKIMINPLLVHYGVKPLTTMLWVRIFWLILTIKLVCNLFKKN